MAAAVKFEDLGAGRFRVEGRLSFDSAAEALETSRKLFADYNAIELDLSGVTATDSAGLALLIEWVSRARHSQCLLHFRHVPQQVLALARISDVESLLPMAA
jgi:phospholipid transport system transporter-binding protein